MPNGDHFLLNLPLEAVHFHARDELNIPRNSRSPSAALSSGAVEILVVGVSGRVFASCAITIPMSHTGEIGMSLRRRRATTMHPGAERH